MCSKHNLIHHICFCFFFFWRGGTEFSEFSGYSKWIWINELKVTWMDLWRWKEEPNYLWRSHCIVWNNEHNYFMTLATAKLFRTNCYCFYFQCEAMIYRNSSCLTGLKCKINSELGSPSDPICLILPRRVRMWNWPAGLVCKVYTAS